MKQEQERKPVEEPIRPAWQRRHLADPGECPFCDRMREYGVTFHPDHDASSSCQSGKREHCTCDTCF